MEAQRFAEIVAEQVYDRRDEYHQLSEEYESAEEHLNQALGCIHELVRDIAAATHALSCGTNDRDSGGVKFLQEALELVKRVFCAKAPTATTLSSSQ